MGRWQGTTAQRGYGRPHQLERERRLARWRPGDPCARCGQPMWGPADRIHLGHTEDRTGYTGLEHSDCNTREGARRGNYARQFVLAAATTAGANVRCKTCGQPYSRASRSCEMCGAHYHPNYGEQRTCGRVCGLALRRRNHGPALTSIPPKPKPACQVCGKPTAGQRRPYCSSACAGQARSDARQTWPSSRIQVYTCRYCGKTATAKATGIPKKACSDRHCQLARLMANNLRVRNGLTQDEADTQAATLLASGQVGQGRWATSRAW